MNHQLSLSRENRLALLILAVTQSLLLLLLHKAISHEAWPATDARWLHAMYTVVTGLPFFFYLAAIDWRDRANLAAGAVLGLLLFWIGWHTGWLMQPYFGGRGGQSIVPVFACGVALSLFVAAFYFRTWRETKRLEYALLLDHSWRNALTLGFLGLFLLVFGLLLMLWAGLFEIIGIDFFRELFDEPEFIYPVFGLMGGWGLGMIRARTGLIATVRNLCEVLIRALLPLVAFIVVIFLGSLPFTGIREFWDTGYASVLLLWLAALVLFFFNAVVAENDELAMNPWLRRFVLLALVLLPANAILAAWALWLRADQYGWTLDRLWALLVESFLAAFSIGYAVLVLRHRGLRVIAIRRWNTLLGAIIAITLLLVHTPLLNFHRIATNNQVERLLSGKTAPDQFDALHVRFSLGQYGIDALEELAASAYAKQQPGLKKRIEAALAASNPWAADPEEHTDLEQLRSRFSALPGTALEDDFLLLLGRTDTPPAPCFRGKVHCAIGELERDGERFRVQLTDVQYAYYMHTWRLEQGEWMLFGDVRRFGCDDAKELLDLEQPLQWLESEFLVFRNGACLYQLLPDAEWFRTSR